jgi:hypothetical protein
VIDEHRAIFHPGKRAVIPERHRAQIIVVADAGHDEILARGSFLGRGGAAAPVAPDPGLGLGGGTAEKSDLPHDFLPNAAADGADCYIAGDCDGVPVPSTAPVARWPVRRDCIDSDFEWT